MRYYFTIPVGDWSGDGHDKRQDFRASSTKPIEAVREAYFNAVAKLPEYSPETFCAKYGDHKVPKKIQDLMRREGIKLDDPTWIAASELAAYIIWFLNQGDVELSAQLAESEPSLAFFGYDAKQRHIGHIGYGLFE